ncbi:MAG: methionyl-tRNA synthetase [Gaiellaceae bacterium]|jgi:methionyl-tRNA synthetase|nr:methionyl-tRNA synthetase [Gaiellaceae bacterium]
MEPDTPAPRRRILVAVAWPYASGPRHIGHVAGFGVPSDIFARYHRLRGSDVLMVSGTDEHGTPVMVAADKEGVSTRELADRYNQLIREDLRNLGLSYDTFTRTTTQNHYRVVRDVFRTLHEKGYIVERTTRAAFSASTGHTLPDRYIEGTCPHCGYRDARGDQCDNCGRQLDPADLIDPRSKIDGSTPEFRDTTHLFLDLPAFADQLRPWIEQQSHWRSNVRNFSLNLVDELQPRPITRDLDWGVPIPVEGYDNRDDKKIYVWFDAVIGYLSASIEWAIARGTPDAWRDWWQNHDARHFYFMGKDNIVFHTVIWPSMLLGYGEGGEIGAGKGPLELPYDVVASEFLTMEGRKFSASRSVGIYVNDFLSRYEPDPLRYFLTIAGPESQDTDFTWAEFVRRTNDELVATWGNLVNRTLTNAYRNFGEVPAPGALTQEDEAAIAVIEEGFASVGDHIEAARFKAALTEAMRLASTANQYVSEQAPWTVIKADRERAGTILYVALRLVDNLKVLLTPFLPFTCQRLHELLGHDGFLAGPLEFREHAEDGASHLVLTGDYASWVGTWSPSELGPGQQLLEPEPLFRKLDPVAVVAEELRRMEAAAGGTAPTAPTGSDT